MAHNDGNLCHRDSDTSKEWTTGIRCFACVCSLTCRWSILHSCRVLLREEMPKRDRDTTEAATPTPAKTVKVDLPSARFGFELMNKADIEAMMTTIQDNLYAVCDQFTREQITLIFNINN